MDYWEWVNSFKPVVNELDSNASVDGYLFMNFGKQWEFVKNFSNQYVWSLIITDLDNGKTLWEIVNGIHVVNREGFLITNKPWSTDTTIVY